MLLKNLQVVEAVNGRIPVFLDGGIRRGTDVFKALALGASGVFVSRVITSCVTNSRAYLLQKGGRGALE